MYFATEVGQIKMNVGFIAHYQLMQVCQVINLLLLFLWECSVEENICFSLFHRH